MPSPPPARAIRPAVVFLIVLAFLLPGLAGHDPWKQDEPYIFSIVDHMMHSGDWVVPRASGEPFMEKPPLYYWTASGFARACAPWLAEWNGARLATGFFMAVAFFFTGLAARRWWGRGHGRVAILALMACLGLVYESHLMMTDIPMLTGFAIACYGFALAGQRPLVGGFWLGIGVGAGFLAKGLLVPGVLGVTALLLPALFANWRRAPYAATLGVALLVALPFLVVWPAALYARSPDLFREWFWENNIGRFFGFSVERLGASNDPWFWAKTLPWFAFPALPLAVVTAWRHRVEIRQNAALQFGLVACAVYLAVLLASASARNGYGFPMLVTLALLAAPAASALPGALNRGIDFATRGIVAAFAGFLWLVWILMIATGHAPAWHFLTKSLPADYSMPFLPIAFAVAALATLLWLFCQSRLALLRERGLASLAAGIALCWLLFAMLWIPWVNEAKSYRHVFATLPVQSYPRIASRCLDESASAMLLYYRGVQTTRPAGNTVNFDALLVESRAYDHPRNIPRDWRLVWDGSRHGDTREHFWLYAPPPKSMPR